MDIIGLLLLGEAEAWWVLSRSFLSTGELYIDLPHNWHASLWRGRSVVGSFPIFLFPGELYIDVPHNA
jgi:hypothetical protein